MKSRIFTLLFVAIALIAVNSKSFSQVAGDYVAIADGDYNVIATWGVSDGAGGTTAATALPTTSLNIWIPVGRTLTNITSAALSKDLHIAGTLVSGVSTTSTKDVTVNGNLYIESTGVLKSTSSNGGSVGTLKVGGSLAAGPCTIQIDGQLGAVSLTDVSGSGFRLYCEAGGITTVQGTGNVNVARFQSGAANARNQNIVIDMNMNVLNSANNGKTLSLENGNAGTAAKILTINAGKTVRFVDNSAYAMLGSQETEAMVQTTGNLTYDIQGTLNTGSKGGIKLTTSSQSASSSEVVTLKIGPTGKLILGTKIVTKVTQPATQSVVYDFADGSIVEFAGATAAAFTSPLITDVQSNMTNFSNLVLNSAEGISLPATTTVRNNLTLNSGKLSLGSNNLTVNGSIEGADSTKYIVTNGTGALIQNVATEETILFPVGCSTTYYDPAVLKPTTATIMSVNVDSVLTLAAAPGYLYNAREWNITSSVPSATNVKLTPSVMTTIGQIPVMGNLVTGAYVNENATLVHKTFDATFSNFGSFVVGTRDVNTDLTINKSKLFITSIGNQLIVNGTQAGQQLTIFNINGQVVSQIIAKNDQTSLNLKSGIYIVNVENQVLKVVM